MRYAFSPPAVVSLPIANSDERFPVRRVYCVGRNYAAHAREMGNDEKDPPFFFAKPADALVESGASIPFPKATQDLHFEMELVVALHKGGEDISPDTALSHVFGYGCGIDLTRRDLQSVAKAARRPWEMGKAFDQSAPCGLIHTVSEVGEQLPQGRICLHQNGALKQDGDLSEQIWPVPDIIAQLSQLVALAPGDLIMTGTPAGVGQTLPGDKLEGRIAGLSPVTVEFLKG